MASRYPDFNDREFDLLKKLTWNTALLADLVSTSVTSISGTANRITASAATGAVTLDIAATYVGQTSITTLGTIATGTWNATAIGATKGGTGQTVYTVGDILYADTTTTLAKLAASTVNFVLTAQGAGIAPIWAPVAGAGLGNFSGPGPAVTNNAVIVFDGVGGLTGKESSVIINAGAVSGITTLTTNDDITISGVTAKFVGQGTGTSSFAGPLTITTTAGDNFSIYKSGGPSITGYKTAATAQTWTIGFEDAWKVYDITGGVTAISVAKGTGVVTLPGNSAGSLTLAGATSSLIAQGSGTSTFAGPVEVTTTAGDNLSIYKGAGPAITGYKTAATAQTWTIGFEDNWKLYDITGSIVPITVTKGSGLVTLPGVVSLTNTTAATTSAGALKVGSGVSTDYVNIGGGAIVAGSSITTGAPTTGTAGAWKLGIAVVSGTSTLLTDRFIQLDVGGTLYKIALVSNV